MPSKLEQLKSMTTIVADTGDIEAINTFHPTDCTTNRSLILNAAAMQNYKHRVAISNRRSIICADQTRQLGG